MLQECFTNQTCIRIACMSDRSVHTAAGNPLEQQKPVVTSTATSTPAAGGSSRAAGASAGRTATTTTAAGGASSPVARIVIVVASRLHKRHRDFGQFRNESRSNNWANDEADKNDEHDEVENGVTNDAPLSQFGLLKRIDRWANLTAEITVS